MVSCGRRTLLLVDLDLGVQVDGSDDQVAGNVEGANDVEGVGVIEGNSLGHLHHSKNDDNVGTAKHILVSSTAHDGNRTNGPGWS